MALAAATIVFLLVLRRVSPRIPGVLALVAIGGVRLLGVLDGILLAILISLTTLMHGVNKLPIRELGRDPETGGYESRERHPLVETVPGLLILRPEGGLYFANARRVAERVFVLADAARPRVLLIDASASPDWEITALAVVADLDRRLRGLGIELWLCALNERPLEMLRESGRAERLDGRLFHAPGEAVERFRLFTETVRR